MRKAEGKKSEVGGRRSDLLAIDIGNTSITFAVYHGVKIVKTFRVATSLYARSINIARKELRGFKPQAAVIASVVPTAGKYLRRHLETQLGLPAYLIGADIEAPVKNRYKNPKQVGMDRLMNAVAVHEKYKRNAIVIDFGTAITFDVVSKKGEYLGGVIAPGIEISLDALFERTALLPKIKLKKPSGILGRDTVESIQAGCSYGIGGLCDRIVDELKSKYANSLVLATGGYAQYMKAYCRSIQKIEPNLVLDGIRRTFELGIAHKR